MVVLSEAGGDVLTEEEAAHIVTTVGELAETEQGEVVYSEAEGTVTNADGTHTVYISQEQVRSLEGVLFL